MSKALESEGALFKLVAKSDRVTRGESDSYKIHNYITRESSPRVSVAVSELNGELPGTLNERSDRVYYFIDAQCTFTFNDGTSLSVKPGDALFIPVKTLYRVDGSFTAVLVNAPAFSPDAEQQFDL